MKYHTHCFRPNIWIDPKYQNQTLFKYKTITRITWNLMYFMFALFEFCCTVHAFLESTVKIQIQTWRLLWKHILPNYKNQKRFMDILFEAKFELILQGLLQCVWYLSTLVNSVFQFWEEHLFPFSHTILFGQFYVRQNNFDQVAILSVTYF